MIIIAFGSQALISLLLSVTARFLLSDLFPLTEIELGLDLDKLATHYPKRVNQTGIEDAYYCNFGKVYTWIDFLRTWGTKTDQTDQEQPYPAESILG